MDDDLREPPRPALTGRHLLELFGLVLIAVGAAVTIVAAFSFDAAAGWVALGGWLSGAGYFAISDRR